MTILNFATFVSMYVISPNGLNVGYMLADQWYICTTCTEGVSRSHSAVIIIRLQSLNLKPTERPAVTKGGRG